MIFRSIVLFLLAANAACTKSQDPNFESLLHKKMPSYLPRRDIEKLIQAAKSHFFENQVEAARMTIGRMGNAEFWQSHSEYAEKESPTCEALILKGIQDYYLQRPYALSMNDAHGKEESGIFQGNYMWLGRYFECQGQTDGKNLVADMCVGIIGPNENPSAGLYLSLCVPNICTPEELKRLFEPGNGTYITVFCPGRDKKYDAVDIVAIVIFSILGLLLASGTCYELYLITKNRLDSKESKKVSTRIFLSFSVIKNTKSLLNTDRKEDNISVLDGIRVLSMAWVVLSHNIVFGIGSIDNVSDIANYYITHGSVLAVVNGTLSVDSFFFLSGLLVTYLGLKKYKKTQSLSVAKVYLHRYLRLTPPVALMMLFAVSLFQKIGSGPLFEMRNEPMLAVCQKYWWTHFLYINNLYPVQFEEQCIHWIWYLADDMQFYLLSPIFIILLFRHTKVTLVVLGFLIVADCAITGALSTKFEIWPDVYYYGMSFRWILFGLSPGAGEYSFRDEPIADVSVTATPKPYEESDSYWNDIYTKPWCRMGVYFVGMITGYILSSKKRIKMNKFFVAFMWIAVPLMELAVVYGFWWKIEEGEYVDNPVSIHLLSFYNAVFRPVWALGLAWLTIACTYGYGGPITPILSFKGFIPLSRLTFSAYLIHPLILNYMYHSLEVQPHFKVNTFVYSFLAAVVLSFASAYPFSMLIEAPVAELQKIIFSSQKTAQKGQRKAVPVDHASRNNAIPNGYDVALFRKKKVGVVNKMEVEEEGGNFYYKATDEVIVGDRL